MKPTYHITDVSLSLNFNDDQPPSLTKIKCHQNKTHTSLKKGNSIKWGNSLKTSKKLVNPPSDTFTSEVLDLSHYKSTRKTEGSTKHNSDQKLKSVPHTNSANHINYNQIPFKKIDMINISQLTLNDSLSHQDLNDTLTNTDEKLMNNSLCKSINESEGGATINQINRTELESVHTLDNPFVLEECSPQDLKEGEYIYDNCIRIVKFLAEGAQAKLYIGLIEEIDKYVAIKRYNIIYDEVHIGKIQEECEIIKNLEHANIIKYFDIEITNIYPEDGEANVDENTAVSCKIDIIMEFLSGGNLKEYLINYAQENKSQGIPIDKVKLIARKILDALIYLHDNKIIHRDLKVK
jgi:hypothetical protein